jgi:hypothetical protein
MDKIFVSRFGALRAHLSYVVVRFVDHGRSAAPLARRLIPNPSEQRLGEKAFETPFLETLLEAELRDASRVCALMSAAQRFAQLALGVRDPVARLAHEELVALVAERSELELDHVAIELELGELDARASEDRMLEDLGHHLGVTRDDALELGLAFVAPSVALGVDALELLLMRRADLGFALLALGLRGTLENEQMHRVPRLLGASEHALQLVRVHVSESLGEEEGVVHLRFPAERRALVAQDLDLLADIVGVAVGRFHHAQLDAALVMGEEDLGTEVRDRVAITARPALLEPDALTERQVEALLDLPELALEPDDLVDRLVPPHVVEAVVLTVVAGFLVRVGLVSAELDFFLSGIHVEGTSFGANGEQDRSLVAPDLASRTHVQLSGSVLDRCRYPAM